MHPLPQLESYTIRTFDIDCHKQLTIPALVRLMQETAMQQVLDLKISVWDLEEYKLAWVLIRKRIEVQRLPLLGEKIPSTPTLLVPTGYLLTVISGCTTKRAYKLPVLVPPGC
jgi:acyl-ACP thioesterase